ncbi:MAG: methionine--tRNA ligase [Methanomassiliicoccus sp.]|nr:methionine--tRNA ligase [Methanomassiliicoccus sp.]
MVKVLVCVAWPYANAPIHLGHVAGSLLPPDIFSKYHRLIGNEVLMVSGSDQHGTPITVKAEKEGVTPEVIAERYHEINKRAIEGLDIEFSLFTKTHTENHFEVVDDVFLTLRDKGYLYKKGTQQYYCPRCAKFLPDRYVEGRCPSCGNEKARGDQCEKCGKTFEGGELEDATCLHCNTEPEMRETEHYFLKLSEFQQPLLDWVEGKENWKSSVRLFTRNWLEAGLQDRPITRDMAWGIPVPIPGWEGKVVYVWFDAVIGYLSASKEWAKMVGRPDAWKAYWEDPSVRSYYFLGKDNIPFHTIIWPAMLMGYGNLNLPYDVPANEFLTFKGDKLSKSRGNSIDIPSMLQKFEVDAIRYYVAVNMPENKDSDFSWADFETKVNNELVATLGNFYHRVMSFTYKHYGMVPEYVGSDVDRREVWDAIETARKQVASDLEACEFKRALKGIMDLAQFGNRYFDGVGPWALIKKDRVACGSALNLNLELVKALAIMSYPFMPRSARGAWKLLGQEGELEAAGWKAIDVPLHGGQKMLEPKPLFSKIIVEKDDASSAFNGFTTLNLKVGQIIEAGNHPNADSLLLMQVDIGRKVQIVAGLKAYYSPEELKGRKVVVVSNLKPAKLRGYESQGMLLAAEAGELVTLLSPPTDAKPGDAVNSGMVPGEKQIEFKDFQKLVLKIGTVTGKGKVDIGREIRCQCPDVAEGAKVAVFLPSPDAEEGLAFFTMDGAPVVADPRLPSGATVR